MSNIVEFPVNPEEPNEPTHYLYEIKTRQPDGGSEVVKCEGYLIATGAFIGICQGPYTKSEFMFISPLENVLYANSLGPVRFTGKLSS